MMVAAETSPMTNGKIVRRLTNTFRGQRCKCRPFILISADTKKKNRKRATTGKEDEKLGKIMKIMKSLQEKVANVESGLKKAAPEKDGMDGLYYRGRYA